MSDLEWAPIDLIIEVEGWENAKLYCQFLNIDGKSGWRLPHEFELHEAIHLLKDTELGYQQFILNYWTAMVKIQYRDASLLVWPTRNKEIL